MSEYPFFFTWSAQKGARGVEMTGGDGAWFNTSDGGRWLDLGALAYQVNVGHGNRRIVEAIKRQADQLCLAAPTTVFPAKLELAQRLLAMAPPGFTKVFFTLGGAEANENAIKIARAVTGRTKLVSRYRSYHGASLGALALTGDWRRPAAEPTIPGVTHILDCYCDRCPFGKTLATCARECATQLDTVLPLEGNVAAVFLEPVPGANGVLVPPPEYWPLVRAACDRAGALLVADEVLTGFGRTGRGFGFQHWDVVPDMITVAKGLTSGYAPMGAVLVHERIAAHFEDKILACGLTSYAHPLGCAAALETLKVYEDDGLYERAAALAPLCEHALRAAAARLPVKSFVRGLGLLWALEIEAPLERWAVFARELAAAKVSTHVDGKRGTIIVSPPLCISEADLLDGLHAIGDAAQVAFGVSPVKHKQKVVPDVAAALAGVEDGMSIMVGGFGLTGNAEALIAGVVARGLRDLTLISNNAGALGKGLATWLRAGCIRKVICSYLGTNEDLHSRMAAGTIEVEVTPQGTLAERMRAAGAGIPAFYTPTGVGTVVEQGKEVREIDGRTYLLERALHADVALIRAAAADPFGNLRFYRTSRNFAPAMATAARCTIAEVDRLVPLGALDPDDVHLPGIFVHRVVEVREHENPIEFRTVRKRP